MMNTFQVESVSVEDKLNDEYIWSQQHVILWPLEWVNLKTFQVESVSIEDKLNDEDISSRKCVNRRQT